jgi:hypothetical protein
LCGREKKAIEEGEDDTYSERKRRKVGKEMNIKKGM